MNHSAFLLSFRNKKQSTARTFFEQPLTRNGLSGLITIMEIRSFARIVGSQKLAAVILVLLCIAMACATVYETMHGSPAALEMFYKSSWFEGLLGLLAVNLLASMIARFPWSRRRIGFVITHISILAILGGAWVSQQFGIDGQISIVEGQSAKQFNMRDKEALSVRQTGEKLTRFIKNIVKGNQATQPVVEELARDVELVGIGGYQPIASLDIPPLSLGSAQITVEQYLPDCRPAERIVDDNPKPACALEVRLAGVDVSSTDWVFAGQKAGSADLPISLLVARDKAEVDRFLAVPTSQPTTAKTVKVEIRGANFEFLLDKCLAGPVKIGDTDLSLHVLRYLPHAQVAEGKKLINASDRPVNPAIEFEIVGPAGTSKKLAFARFPEFGSMHGGQDSADQVKVLLNVPGSSTVATAITLIAGPDGRMAGRFDAGDSSPMLKELKVGMPVATPWESLQFTVLRRFDHARREPTVEIIEPPSDERTPAIFVTAKAGGQQKQLWLRKYEPSKIALGNKGYELTYGDKALHLGFEVRLRKFVVGRYPGTSQPRTFESHVTLVDANGVEQNRVISMNNPAKRGGYTLFQSSYQQGRTGPATSVLSVAWDPGLPIVFAGYITLILGMLYVLVMRMRG